MALYLPSGGSSRERADWIKARHAGLEPSLLPSAAELRMARRIREEGRQRREARAKARVEKEARRTFEARLPNQQGGKTAQTVQVEVEEFDPEPWYGKVPGKRFELLGGPYDRGFILVGGPAGQVKPHGPDVVEVLSPAIVEEMQLPVLRAEEERREFDREHPRIPPNATIQLPTNRGRGIQPGMARTKELAAKAPGRIVRGGMRAGQKVIRSSNGRQKTYLGLLALLLFLFVVLIKLRIGGQQESRWELMRDAITGKVKVV